ncbi:histidine kinase dimerization/phospho-acceptor domain-containing protein, partial [Acinetobacter baumannii]|nr:histidine kinase dimerization/phospho-acceptor domain-containing protein [Acinetobacter baumannii]
MNQHQEKISTLISDISHQTKTPLSNVSLYTELLLEKELPEDAKHCAEQVHAQAEKLQFLIGALVQT